MKTSLICLAILLYSVILSAQSIDELLMQAVENNPELKSLELQYESAMTKSKQVSSLPQPTIGIGVPIQSPETRLGSQVLMISANQMFPWFGTLKSKEDVALSMAKNKYERVALTRLDLFFKIKNAYYQLYLINEKQRILKESIRLLNTLESVSLAKVESGNATAADVLRIQIKSMELEQQIRILQNNKQMYYAQINDLTNRNTADTIQITERFETIEPLSFDLAVYQSKLEENHPMLNQLNWQIEASKAEQKNNRKMGLPTFGIGMDYSMVNKRVDDNPEFNGRDILIPKATLSIPVFRNQYHSKNEEEEYTQEGLKFQKEAAINKLLNSLQAYKVDYDNALLNIEWTEKQMKSTESAYDILLSKYSGTGQNFDEVIQLQMQLIQYNLELIEATIQTYISTANIERITDF